MGVIMDALNRRSPAEAAQYVLDHMASMVEPIQVIALRHVVERLLAEVTTVDGAPERPAWTWRAIERLQERMLAAEAERDALAARLTQAEQVIERARQLVECERLLAAQKTNLGEPYTTCQHQTDLAAAVDALDGKKTKP
jgi:hypothetical protein